MSLYERYHVPRSQVWTGSRGGQSGNVHLHTDEDYSVGRIHRKAGQALCGRSGWYERPADSNDGGRCQRCEEIAARRVEPVKLYETTQEVNAMIRERLEELRQALRAENISYGELHELQSLAEHIEPGDVELLEAAGVPEFPYEDAQNFLHDASEYLSERDGATPDPEAALTAIDEARTAILAQIERILAQIERTTPLEQRKARGADMA